MEPTREPDYPAPDTTCNDDTGYCAGTCYKEGERYVYEVSTDTADYQCYCLCEHHADLNIDLRRYTGINLSSRTGANTK